MVSQGSFQLLSKKNITSTFSWGKIHLTCRLRIKSKESNISNRDGVITYFCWNLTRVVYNVIGNTNEISWRKDTDDLDTNKGRYYSKKIPRNDYCQFHRLRRFEWAIIPFYALFYINLSSASPRIYW